MRALTEVPEIAKVKVANFTGVKHHMTGLSGAAKAVTPFGPLAGRTPIKVSNNGTDLAIIDFLCGDTPVSLAVSGDNFIALVRQLIEQASDLNRARLTSELEEAMGA